jgi:2-amino-4-hydroxy-6-hydroxymethyldihydropteridine diphosphokinase
MVIIGLGANLPCCNKPPVQNMENAIQILAGHGEVERCRASRFYASSPVGPSDQPDYINAVAVLDTSLDPMALMSVLLDVEKRFGRVRSERWGPRTMDLDLIDFDGQVLDLKARGEDGQEITLHLPHPRLAERAFVLLPLLELVPEWTHPITGHKAFDLLKNVDEAQSISVLGQF